MVQIKLNPGANFKLVRQASEVNSVSLHDTIVGLQQQVEKLREQNERTSFYLYEVAQWAEHVKRK